MHQHNIVVYATLIVADPEIKSSEVPGIFHQRRALVWEHTVPWGRLDMGMWFWIQNYTVDVDLRGGARRSGGSNINVW